MKIIFGILLAATIACSSATASSLQDEKNLLRAEAVEALVAEMGLREHDTASRDMPGWHKPGKVLFLNRGYWDLEKLQAVAPGVEIVEVSGRQEAEVNVVGADAVIGLCSESVLAAEPGLHWVQVYTAGVDRCVPNPSMKTGNKLLTNGQRIASPALAEHAIAMMMSLVRGLDLYHSNQIKGEWRDDVGLARGEYMELDGRTVLVVGLGGIGTQVARKAHGLGMRVIATRGSRREGPDYVEYVGLADEVNTLATQADVVINTAPLTDMTRGMFDAAFFESMKSSAYFISVGRGASTNTDDLVAALNKKKIAGAGLDVTDPEPLPKGHVLWNTPRVIITPHNGGRSDRSWDRLFLLIQENLRRYVEGEALYSVVDIERGY
jgi:phosphoglycerate dehydrogenase-like enzyme